MNHTRRIALLVSILLSTLGSTGCDSNPAKEYIQGANFRLSDDLKSARVSLVFTDKVKAAFEAEFAIQQYGYVFTEPHVDGKQPFAAGFELDLGIVYDNGFAQMAPTSVLPNGLPIGLPNPVVEIQAGSVAAGAAKFLAYVDVKGTSWLGMASMIEAVDSNFPAGLSLTQVFRRDGQGVPEVFGSFFGPTLDAQGQVVKAGGLAIFANVRALVGAARERGDRTIELKPESNLILSGPAAAYYRSHPAELARVGRAYLQAISTLR